MSSSAVERVPAEPDTDSCPSPSCSAKARPPSLRPPIRSITFAMAALPACFKCLSTNKPVDTSVMGPNQKGSFLFVRWLLRAFNSRGWRAATATLFVSPPIPTPPLVPIRLEITHNSPRWAFPSEEHSSDGTRHHGCENATHHRSEGELGEITPSFRGDAADPTDLDANAGEVGKTCQGIRDNHR